MSTKEDEFLKKLRETFKVEAEDHLRSIGTGLLALESNPEPSSQREIVETVFRAAHSLKGAARAVDFDEIESMCQSMEDIIAAWRRRERPPLPTSLDTLHRTLNAIAAVLSAPKASGGVRAPAARPSPGQLIIGRPEVSVPAARGIPQTRAAEPRASSSTETVRISIATLEAQFIEAEEMLTVKRSIGQHAADLCELVHRFETWRAEWSAVAPQAHALRQALDRPGPGRAAPHSLGWDRLLDFFDWSLDTIGSIENQTTALGRVAERDRFATAKLVDGLVDNSKRLLLVPFSTISASLQKQVRDLCRDQGKEADLTIRGDDVALDRRVLEEMKDPLIHLLRNCVDHGVESPNERIRNGKPSRAAITLVLAQIEGNKVQLVLSDDGAGIDTGKVKDSAVRRGLISVEESTRLNEHEAQALIFQSDVSTSPIITRLSGRGLGLAIVREKAENLGGEVSIESRPGLGSTFRLLVPATRATFRGILIEVAGRLLVVPTVRVERVMRAGPGEVRTVEGRETFLLDGRVVPLVQLADALELPPEERKGAPSAGPLVIILGSGGQRVAFAVDAVLDEQEVLVKPLLKPLSRVRNIGGVTVLGSGQLALILNAADLLKSARKLDRAPTRVAASTAPARQRTRRILLAEDSITSRMLLKGVLESAGYDVRVAVDGMEAFALLRGETFDLVVSDVEMPRLSGFDLTAKIRADRKLAELPVILITALETREDRERGIDTGASAYLIKSKFDQSDLLEAVGRLI